MRTAAMCATRNMYDDLGPPIKALLVNSDVEKIYVLAEDPDPGVYLPPECEVIDVSGQEYFSRACPNWSNPWSWIVLMRAVYYRMFPELDRILSIDLDAFALRDVSGLWQLDMTGKLLAGVRETSKLARPEFPYYNAGVLMQNLDLLRRSGAGAAKKEEPAANDLTIGTIRLDLDARNAYKNGELADLTAKEFDVIEFLMRNPNRVYSREALLDTIWAYEYRSDIRTVDVHIRRLREKLEENPAEPKYILTKWGVGYYFRKQS